MQCPLQSGGSGQELVEVEGLPNAIRQTDRLGGGT
jgi:hypothetical protein